MSVKVVPVIMSGGSGTRLWPLSRVQHPKQLHALVTDLTMLQATVDRVSAAQADFAFADPIIVLNSLQHELADEQMRSMGHSQTRYVVEPVGRNTAPVAAVASELARQAYGDDVLVLLLPADHHIKDVTAFHDAISAAAKLAAAGSIVTFGIEPEGPETGYGYIKRGAPTGPGFVVDRFMEKPDIKKAEAFVESGEYYWNAGIFMFRVGTLLEEMREHSNDVLEPSLRAVEDGAGSDIRLDLCRDAFAKCPDISFDYAVMERTENAAVIPASIGWSDVGSWSALWEIAEKNDQGNATRGDVELVDCQDSFAITTGRKLALVGLSDMIAVATDDAVLVAHRDASQDVKSVVNALKEKKRFDLL